LSKPDGITRKEFSFDVGYIVETWLLFPASRRDTNLMKEVQMYFGESSNLLYDSSRVEMTNGTSGN